MAFGCEIEFWRFTNESFDNVVVFDFAEGHCFMEYVGELQQQQVGFFSVFRDFGFQLFYLLWDVFCLFDLFGGVFSLFFEVCDFCGYLFAFVAELVCF